MAIKVDILSCKHLLLACEQVYDLNRAWNLTALLTNRTRPRLATDKKSSIATRPSRYTLSHLEAHPRHSYDSHNSCTPSLLLRSIKCTCALATADDDGCPHQAPVQLIGVVWFIYWPGVSGARPSRSWRASGYCTTFQDPLAHDCISSTALLATTCAGSRIETVEPLSGEVSVLASRTSWSYRPCIIGPAPSPGRPLLLPTPEAGT